VILHFMKVSIKPWSTEKDSKRDCTRAVLVKRDVSSISLPARYRMDPIVKVLKKCSNRLPGRQTQLYLRLMKICYMFRLNLKPSSGRGWKLNIQNLTTLVIEYLGWNLKHFISIYSVWYNRIYP
jgi:hypothetical protein